MATNGAELSVIFATDCETSGMSFTSNDPSDGFQSVAWGIVAADAKTFKEIDQLYLEIKWDGVSGWNWKAEQIHGLSKEHLEKHGVSKQEAAEMIAEFIYKYVEPEQAVTLLGQNVARFDLVFLRKLMHECDLPIKFSHRQIDSFSIGFATLGAFSSDHLFEILNIKRPNPHNALADARASLKSIRYIHEIFKLGLNHEA
jgi:oligoribonuclease (3'-5' exoribonuclease)